MGLTDARFAPMARLVRRVSALLVACTIPMFAQAVQVCDLDGQSVNPANGSTTAGKSGLMRCRDGDSGPVIREEEIQRGVFMGVVRYFRAGVLEREFSVNERGNRDGRSREYAATPGPKNQLLREETMRNGTTVGLARTWYADGTLKRLTFYGDDEREQAVAAFTQQGRLTELRCANQPRLAPDADDATWCGHRGNGVATVDLYASSGKLRGRISHERGERRKLETLWDNGKLRDQIETNATDGSERNFSADGVKRKESAWITRQSDNRSSRITTLEQEFHESGTLVHERRWLPSDRGGELQLEQHWYLNGQLRDKVEYLVQDGQLVKRDTRYHDNGRVASEGLWLVKSRFDSQPIGLHKSFDDAGHLRAERTYDGKGRSTREREFDETGRTTRDDEVFEDGSRKAFAR
jgi:antitoxin component YwqK of YwqJK toxin-antitoxin module